MYLDLGNQPASNSFIFIKDIKNEKKFPLQVFLCESCGLSQLGTVVSVEEIFGEYAYRSSSSRALEESFQSLKNRIMQFEEEIPIVNSKLLVDIGCNDGSLLQQFRDSKFELLGVEPSSTAKFARESGFEVEQEFFGAETAKIFLQKYGPAGYIVVTNVLAHVPDIESFMIGVHTWLSEDGVFVVEFPYVIDMVKNLWFDTVYHEHLSYLSITPLNQLFSRIGMKVISIERNEIGGSGPFLRLSATKIGKERIFAANNQLEYFLELERIFDSKNPKSYLGFSAQVQRLRMVVLEKLNKWITEGKKIGGFGAPAKGNTFLNYLGLDSSIISEIADNTLEKIGKITPGSHIPIVDDKLFLKREYDIALLLSWNYLDYFVNNSEYFKQGGVFYCPFPSPMIIDQLAKD